MALENTRFFNFIELQYEKLNEQINNWLQVVYNKSDLQFDVSSPYGQILTVQKELFTHNIIYLKNSVEQINIETSQDERTIRYISRIAGHNPTRTVSASGVLKFKVKGGVNISDEIKSTSPSITINNRTLIKNETNGLQYSINLGTIDSNIFPISNNSVFYLNILQGKWETQTFTGNGLRGQSISVNVSNNAKIDNFNFSIYVNNIRLKIVSHTWDMLRNEFSCVAKTGFNGGLDVYFGNVDYGIAPAEGSIIKVEYLLSNGVEGEILNPLLNDWKFEDSVRDGNGDEVKMEDLFDTEIYNDVGFASDGEDVATTKSLIPIVSRNFVLATPDQFVYHLTKLGVFSQVDAFNKLEDNDFSFYTTNQTIQNQLKKLKDGINNGSNKTDLLNIVQNIDSDYGKFWNNTNDNIIFLFLIPKIRKYLSNEVNYFNLPLDVFSLDDYEQQKVINYLNAQGVLSMTTEVRVLQPKISKYVCKIYVNRFEDTNEDNIRERIINVVSNFMLDNIRTDRIVKSEIIAEIKSIITEIDSIDIQFISKKNEDYHFTRGASLGKNYDVNTLLGIDRLHGDIILEKEEYPLVRGGWSDRNSNFYTDQLKTSGLSSINVRFGKKLIKK
jgi:hypothetical protein